MTKLLLWIFIRLIFLNPTISDLWEKSAYAPGVVLASVAKDITYKKKMFLLSCQEKSDFVPKQSSDLALVLSSPPLVSLTLGSWSLWEYTAKKANSHALLKSLYTPNVTFGIAQIYIVINAMYIFLLHCSSCSAGSSWLRWISPGAQGPGMLFWEVSLSCLCKQLPPIVLHQCPLRL